MIHTDPTRLWPRKWDGVLRTSTCNQELETAIIKHHNRQKYHVSNKNSIWKPALTKWLLLKPMLLKSESGTSTPWHLPCIASDNGIDFFIYAPLTRNLVEVLNAWKALAQLKFLLRLSVGTTRTAQCSRKWAVLVNGNELRFIPITFNTIPCVISRCLPLSYIVCSLWVGSVYREWGVENKDSESDGFEFGRGCWSMATVH